MAASSHTLQVGILEKRRVFQAVTEHAVEGDVGLPDETEQEGPAPAFEHRGRAEHQREHFRVRQVVQGRADADIRQVAEHEQIGPQEQEKEQQPAPIELVVGGKADCKNGESFGVKQETRHGFFDAPAPGRLLELRE